MRSDPALKQADLAVVIGRWQLVHQGHVHLLRRALALAPQVAVVLGSAWRSRDTRHPFSWQEREQMLRAALTPEEAQRLRFLPLRDFYDHRRWLQALQAGVDALCPRGTRIVALSHRREPADVPPIWAREVVEPASSAPANALREVFFLSQQREAALQVLAQHVPPGVLHYLQAWSHLPAYEHLRREFAAVQAYRQRWTAPVSITADAVVVASRQVLLIRRGGDIGHGLWALPGGFVEPGETFLTAALRELKEETQLGLLDTSLRLALQGSAVFDHPLRSARARIVTQAFHFDLGDLAPPEVHGADDAGQAAWVPLDELPRYEEQLFEDHAAILDHFVGLFADASSSSSSSSSNLTRPG